MAKGYWIPHLDVSDPEGFQAYMAGRRGAPALRLKLLVRGGRARWSKASAAGPQRAARIQLYADALACYHSSRILSARIRCACRIRPAIS